MSARARLLRGALVATLVVLALDQGLLRFALVDGWLGDRRIAPFDPPLFTPLHEARLAEARELVARGAEPPFFDAELGWCARPQAQEGAVSYDALGARRHAEPFPAHAMPGVRRVVALGGSFTRGDEVADDETWAARLDARRADLAIANLGVGGYGIDQACLRHDRDGAPLTPDEVWLGFLPAAALRVTTCFPPLHRHWSTPVAFKPRFALADDGALALVPSPVRAFPDFVRLLEDGRAFEREVGPNDLWVRRCPAAYAPTGTRWLHASGIGRLALTWLERRGRDPAPWLADPASEPFRLSLALVERLRARVERDGGRLRVLVLPSRADLRAPLCDGQRYWQQLVDAWAASGVDCLDATAALVAADAARDEGFWRPQGHYSAAGNDLVATLLEGTFGAAAAR